jgi:hypothetical protein
MRTAIILSSVFASGFGSTVEGPACSWFDSYILDKTSSFSLFLENKELVTKPYTQTSPYTLIGEDCQKCLDTIVNESEFTRAAFDDMVKQKYFDMDILRHMEQKFRTSCLTNLRSSIWNWVASFRGRN